ncbi:hypothetical protein [Nostoc commune]|nr:hypothetical protein [Nostoc commune]
MGITYFAIMGDRVSPHLLFSAGGRLTRISFPNKDSSAANCLMNSR